MISIGTLSKRKDPEFIVRNLAKTNLSQKHIMIFLGNGELREKCEQIKM